MAAKIFKTREDVCTTGQIPVAASSKMLRCAASRWTEAKLTVR